MKEYALNIFIVLTAIVAVGAIPFNMVSTFWGNIKPFIDAVYLLSVFIGLFWLYTGQKKYKKNFLTLACLNALIVTGIINVWYGATVSREMFRYNYLSDAEMQEKIRHIFYLPFSLYIISGGALVMTIFFFYLSKYQNKT